jgi:hypothetical protein
MYPAPVSKGNRLVTWDMVVKAGALLGLVLSLLTLYRYLWPDRPRFGTQVSVERIALAKPLEDAIGDLPYETKAKLDLFRYSRLSRYVKLTMTNSGTRPAKNVALQIGQDGIARIKHRGEKPQQIDFEKRIIIGDLPVRETIEIEWWDQAWSPFFSFHTIEVCHDDGVDKITLPRQFSGMFDAFVSQTGFVGVMAVVLVLVIGPGVLQTWLSIRAEQAKKAEAKTEAAAPANPMDAAATK